MRINTISRMNALLVSALFSAQFASSVAYAAAPDQALWAQHMRSFGKKYCNKAQIDNLSTWEGNVWYYDGIKVYYEIANYTHNKSWYKCADYVRGVYRKYVLNNNGAIGAWRVFPQGLLLDYQRTHDPKSRAAILALAKNSPYARSAGSADPEISRETAYLIHTFRAAASVGKAEPAKLATAVTYALGHLAAWRTKQTSYVKPFMAALSMEALIDYDDAHSDARVLPAVQATADWMWDSLWDGNARKFPYITCWTPNASTECNSPDNAGSADLDLLNAPVYAWLYAKTKDSKYKIMADAIFTGGVERAYLDTGKQFNQNYRWSFDYINWRGK